MDIKFGTVVTYEQIQDLPIGTIVKYEVYPGLNGGMPPTWTMDVRMLNGRKVLGFPGMPFGRPGYPNQFVHGENGKITILSA